MTPAQLHPLAQNSQLDLVVSLRSSIGLISAFAVALAAIVLATGPSGVLSWRQPLAGKPSCPLRWQPAVCGSESRSDASPLVAVVERGIAQSGFG